MNSTAISPSLHAARNMSNDQKKHLALAAFTQVKTVTQLADENDTSRKFIRQQKCTVVQAIDAAFHPTVTTDRVLFYLPVSKRWIEQLVLALMLMNVSYRQISTLLSDVFDYTLSIARIHTMFNDAVEKAQQHHVTEDLSGIHVTANDELFYLSKPILSGIDTLSLYCYLLSAEDHRDEDTWAIYFLDCQSKGLNPQRTLGDDAKGLVSGHTLVFPEVPYHYDNFHLSRELMNVRRFFRNRLKTAIAELKRLQKQSIKWTEDDNKYQQLASAIQNEHDARYLSKTLDTLISWLEHDILNKAGPTNIERCALYDFIVDEFKKLEMIEPHRIATLRVTLENKRNAALGFVEVLDNKFVAISEQFSVDIQTIWAMCLLQRCKALELNYTHRSAPLEKELGHRFDDIEDAVIDALASTERTSSMIENLNGRVRRHLRYRQESGHGFLDLLRFYLNHTPFNRSTRSERHKKSPAEILLGKPHPHWLEMLGYTRFKRAA